MGVKLVFLNFTDSKFNLFSSLNSFLLSIQGAPKVLKGFDVPRPSEIFVASNNTVDG